MIHGFLASASQLGFPTRFGRATGYVGVEGFTHNSRGLRSTQNVLAKIQKELSDSPQPQASLPCPSASSETASGHVTTRASSRKILQSYAQSSIRKSAGINNFGSAVWLHDYNVSHTRNDNTVRREEDQFLLAALDRSLRFPTKWQRQTFDGPHGRRDAEEALRSKWPEVLCKLVRSTRTPMGVLLAQKGQNLKLLGACRRASTLRSRVRSVRKFLSWLAGASGVFFPSETQLLTEFLQVRHSESCNGGSLKGTHQSFVFLEVAAAVVVRVTNNAVYTVLYKELFSSTLPGRPRRQAPRIPTVMLQAVEDLVPDEISLFYFRV